MSDKYKFQLIRNYLKFHVKDGRELKDLLDYLDQLQQKEKIIKEVREYIEKHIAIFKDGDMLVDMNIDELLEILDKENK